MTVEDRSVVGEKLPLYASFARNADGPMLARSWLLTNEEPYIRGSGLRVRVGSRAVQVGWYRKYKPFARPVGGVEQVRAWDNGLRHQEESPAGATDSAPEQDAEAGCA